MSKSTWGKLGHEGQNGTFLFRSWLTNLNVNLVENPDLETVVHVEFTIPLGRLISKNEIFVLKPAHPHLVFKQNSVPFCPNFAHRALQFPINI